MNKCHLHNCRWQVTVIINVQPPHLAGCRQAEGWAGSGRQAGNKPPQPGSSSRQAGKVGWGRQEGRQAKGITQQQPPPGCKAGMQTGGVRGSMGRQWGGRKRRGKAGSGVWVSQQMPTNGGRWGRHAQQHQATTTTGRQASGVTGTGRQAGSGGACHPGVGGAGRQLGRGCKAEQQNNTNQPTTSQPTKQQFAPEVVVRWGGVRAGAAGLAGRWHKHKYPQCHQRGCTCPPPILGAGGGWVAGRWQAGGRWLPGPGHKVSLQ